MSTSSWVEVASWLMEGEGAMMLRGALILLVGLPLASALARVTQRYVEGRVDRQRGMIAHRLLRYGLSALVLVTALRHFGFDLSVLVGAAGVMTVAVGFASQTSASNLISGFFLMAEQPFVAGDIIKVGTTTGEVVSIDSLSVKLRTYDNLLVRIPNENLLKSELTNLTHFAIRRVDIPIRVAYREDVPRVRSILARVAEANPLCLVEPKPLFVFLGFGESALELRFSVWVAKENYVVVQTAIYEAIGSAFDAAGIEIPVQHRTLYAGSAAQPFPVRVVPEPPPDVEAGTT